MIWIKRILIIVGTLITVYVLSIFFFVYSPTISDYFNRIDFESQTWINWEETVSARSVRWDMAHDLTKNYKLIGLNVTEIKKLLGKPEYEGNYEIRYYLGITGHGINTGSLNFKILNGIVIEYEIWQG